MDVASLVVGLPPLIAGFWKVGQSINDLRRRFTSIPSVLASLELQCHALSNSLVFLQSTNFLEALNVSTHSKQTTQPTDRLVKLCQSGLSDARSIVEHLQGDQSIESRAITKAVWSRNAKALWNENRIKDLSGYQSDIGTLIMISQSYSIESVKQGFNHSVTLGDNTLQASLPPLSICGASSADQTALPNECDFSFISDDKFSTTTLYLNHTRTILEHRQFELELEREIFGSRTYPRHFADKPHTMETLQLVILGDSGVGKSSMISQFLESVYIEQFDPTIEDLHVKNCNIDGQMARLCITDTNGLLDAFYDLHAEYARLGDCFILVYDICSVCSFEQLERFHELLLGASRKPPIIVIGNKLDQQAERVITSQQGVAFANRVNAAAFLEVSAKSGDCVKQVFYEAARAVRLRKKLGDHNAGNSAS